MNTPIPSAGAAFSPLPYLQREGQEFWKHLEDSERIYKQRVGTTIEMTPHKAWPAFVGAKNHHCPLPWRVHCDSSIPVSPQVSHPALSSTLPFFPLSGLSSLIPYSTSLVPPAWQAPMAWRESSLRGCFQRCFSRVEPLLSAEFWFIPGLP